MPHQSRPSLIRQPSCLALLIVLLSAFGCGGSGKPSLVLPEGPPVRVLFVGNSLTTLHDVPALVQAMAAAGGVRVEYQVYAAADYSLADHWNDGQGLRLLAEKKWDYVVLQQGPSTLAESQAELRDFATRWAKQAREHGAKAALYGVWAANGQKNGFELNDRSYRAAAQAADAVLIPTGKAWAALLQEYPGHSLYLPDGLHANPEGAWLAALVITERLARVKPETVPARLLLADGKTVEVVPEHVKLLQQAAAKAVEGEPTR